MVQKFTYFVQRYCPIVYCLWLNDVRLYGFKLLDSSSGRYRRYVKLPDFSVGYLGGVYIMYIGNQLDYYDFNNLCIYIEDCFGRYGTPCYVRFANADVMKISSGNIEYLDDFERACFCAEMNIKL